MTPLFRDIPAAAAALLLEGLLIAGLLIERLRRRRSQQLLAERLSFEKLIAEISASLSGIPMEQVDRGVSSALQRIAQVAGVEAAALRIVKGGQVDTLRLLRWPAVVAPDFEWRVADVPFTVGQILAGNDVVFTDAGELPEEAAVDREAFRRAGLTSLLLIPLMLRDGMHGIFTLGCYGRRHDWPGEFVAQAHTLAQILSNALARREAELEMRASESLQQAVMSSLRGYVVIADRDGLVLGANEGYRSIAESWHPAPFAAVSIGDSYTRAWERGGYSAADEAPRILQAAKEVLGGSRTNASLECRFRSGYGDRWLEIHAQRLDRPEGGAVITHLDITARKRTEFEAARNLGEISHLNRVAAVGEMAASLAHELNQPLAAIVANGEAAAYLLESPCPDVDEVKGALADIVEDGRRAGEVIHNMRALLRKGNTERSTVDLNAVVAETVRLVRNGALLIRVHLSLEFSPALPPVSVDPIQIQQVILNLVSNAIDAMSTVPDTCRKLTIRTLATSGPAGVQVEVRDSGPGIPENWKSSAFQPFFTTKEKGLGVGLSVSRSIVESHGGIIWAENHPDGGAVFRFFLPATAP